MRAVLPLVLLMACGPRWVDDANLAAAAEPFRAYDVHGSRVTITEVDSSLNPSTGAIVWSLDVENAQGAVTNYSLEIEPFDGKGRRLIVSTPEAPRLAVALAAPGFGVSLDVRGFSQLTSRGPFVLDAQQLAMEPSPFLPLDLQVLGHLHPPRHSDPVAAQAAFDSLVTSRADVFDTFRFRADLYALPPDGRTTLSNDIERWAFEGTPLNWMKHGEVDHLSALRAPVSDEAQDPNNELYSYGGFFNGHHAYLDRYEQVLATSGGALGKIPFRRLPSWDPGTGVPLEFQQRVLHANDAPSIPLKYWPGPAFCARFVNLVEFFDEYVFWHDVVHLVSGGTFGIVHDSAQTGLFWPWHATVDTVYANWRQCQD